MEKEKRYDTPHDVLEEGISYFEQGEYEQALLAFNHLFNLKNDDSTLLFYIGSVHMQLGNRGLAKLLLELAVDKRPDFPEAWNNLGFCHHEENQIKKAEECFQKALDLMPDNADMVSNAASVYVNNGTPDKAIEWCNKALAIDPDHPHAKWNRGLAYLEKGDWINGWEGYEQGIETGNRKERDYSTVEGKTTPYWEGTAGKSIVVFGEQGVGDECLFASMIPEIAKDNNIIFDCHPRLVNLFKRSFDDVIVYGTRKEEYIQWAHRHRIDAKLHIGSLGKFYATKESDFPKKPYMKPDRWLVDHYTEKFREMSDRKKVVIHWKGGTLKTNKTYRSIPLEDFSSFILPNDADFISLQYTPEAQLMVDEFNEKYGKKIYHWQDAVDDLDDVAALLTACDLVITVCTSIVHMSGALGVECWCLCPSKPAWRYGVSGPIPWYESVKLYRQKDDDWDTVLKQVNKDLQKRLEN